MGFVARIDNGADEAPMMKGLIVAVARSRAVLVCANYGRSGHEKRDCLQLIGFLEWYT